MGWHIDFNFFEGGIKRGGIKKSGAIRKVLQSLLHPRMYRRSEEEGSFTPTIPHSLLLLSSGRDMGGAKDNNICFTSIKIKYYITTKGSNGKQKN